MGRIPRSTERISSYKSNSISPLLDFCSTLSQHAFFIVTLARPTWPNLKITNHSFRYAASCLWNELLTELREPCQIVSFTFTYHTWQLIIFIIFTITVFIFSYSFSLFTLNLRLGSLVNRFLYRPFLLLLDWFHGLSDHLMFLFCSAAGFVCVVC